MRFDLLRLRLEFIARESIQFPRGKAANTLRGALGTVFSYAAGRAGPSGLADPPRPFVFRARHLNGRSIATGESFYFDLHVFDRNRALAAKLEEAFASIAREGLGPGRGKAELERSEPELISVDLSPLPNASRRIHVDFLSPTELKQGGDLVDKPDFPILFSRIRDRISTLRALYGSGPLDIDFAASAARAAAVAMTNCAIRKIDIQRRSSRTGQVHGIGGFVGFAEYEGDLAEFLPYLDAACWTGVGRQAVWGKGEIQVVPPVRC